MLSPELTFRVRSSPPTPRSPRAAARPSPCPHPSGTAPTPLGLHDLSELTRGVAEQVRTGAHDVVLNPHQRWYRRLYADPFVDVWLISWAVEQATELHDHAGSLGALTVVSGELQEQRWVPASVPCVPAGCAAGKGATFALGHVHDVVNASRDMP